MVMWQYITQMRPQGDNSCLPSVVPTLSSKELRHENEAVKLSMKQVES